LPFLYLQEAISLWLYQKCVFFIVNIFLSSLAKFQSVKLLESSFFGGDPEMTEEGG